MHFIFSCIVFSPQSNFDRTDRKVTSQEYDPDLPPELAAATGMHDYPTDNTNLGKSEGGQSDFAKGSARMRPPIVCIDFQVSSLQTISCLLQFYILQDRYIGLHINILFDICML